MSPTANGNRDQKTKPKGGHSWCDICDRRIVAEGEKCKCGHRKPSKHRRRR